MHKDVTRSRSFPAGMGLCAVAAFMLLLSAPSSALAGRLILRIKAVNPIEKSQVVSIRSNLPQGVSSNDVLNLDGLELGYDVRNDIYYVHRDVQLGPKQTVPFNVEIRDIWQIDEAELSDLLMQAQNLTAMLVATEFHGTAKAFKQQVESAVAGARQSQKENAIRANVPPIQHIAAYDSNRKLLARAKRDVGHIENLVLESGQDPGRLLGEDRQALRLRRDIELPIGDYGQAIVQIVVKNTSPSESRTTDVHRALPPEVGPDDVIDAGGMAVTVDPESRICYVTMEDVELAAQEEATFNVTIRDKWNISGPRIRTLSDNASNLLVRLTEKGKFQSLNTELNTIMQDLRSVAQEQGPATLSPAYVAFYREQARRVDELEQKINRVRSALIPIEKRAKYGFPIKPPTMKTTWLIIYIVLGFLGILSLLFFLRWYGKTRDEQMWAKLAKSGPKDEANGSKIVEDG